MQKTPLIAVSLHNAAHVRVLREIAARAAGHQYLHARALVLFQQNRPQPPLGGREGRESRDGGRGRREEAEVEGAN